MKILSLFSGIGGFDLAAKNMGWEIIGACEIDRYARAIYTRHFPGVKIYKDATKIKAEELPDFDIICAGFPCQTFSAAGKRLGFEESRGTLFFEIARIARQKRPRLLLLENVKGLLSHDRGKTFAVILSTLDELGYDAQWQMLNSKYWVPQNRERIFIVGHLRGTPRPQVFPFREISELYTEQKKFPTVRALTAGGNSGGLHSQMTILYHQKSKTQSARIYDKKGISPTLGIGHTMQSPNVAIPVITPNRKKSRQNGRRFKTDGEPAFTITTQESHGIFDGKLMRRLTPKECERLQGFPDDYTKYGIEKGKTVEISDTQRYKCIGNAITVPVVQEIMRKLC